MVDPEAKSNKTGLAYFGEELKWWRTNAGVTQEVLGAHVSYTASMIGFLESGKRMPSDTFPAAADQLLSTGGVLDRLWRRVSLGGFPALLPVFTELEAAASAICSFQTQVVPGLLQTEEYARAVISAVRGLDVEKRVAARLERQQLLQRPESPLFWVVLEESTLTRRIGGPEVQRAQLQKLLDSMILPNVVLQILPHEVLVHPSLDGPLTLMSFAEGPDLAYRELLGNGQVIADSAQVSRCNFGFNLLRAEALSPSKSAELITSIMKGIGA